MEASTSAKGTMLPHTTEVTMDTSLVFSNEFFYEELIRGTQLEERSEEEQLDSVVPYPEPKIFAYFASKSYVNKKENETMEQFEERLQLPTGWKLLTTANNLAFKKTIRGYYGTCFWHPYHRWIIIAHRGTDPSNLDALRADINGILGGKYVKQINAACTFTHKIYETVKKCQDLIKTKFEIFFTGHSLGAWLAQVTTFSLEYLTLINDTFLKNTDPNGGYHAHTEVFDSPGCRDMLTRMADDFDVRYSGKTSKLGNLDVTIYLSSPNFVNCCNLQVGRLYRVYPKINSQENQNGDVNQDGGKIASNVNQDGGKIASNVNQDGGKIASDVNQDGGKYWILWWASEKLWEFVPFRYTLSSHSMDGILEIFYTTNPLLIKEVVDWPKIKVSLWQWKLWKISKTIMGKEYQDLFEWSNDLTEYEPNMEDVTFEESYVTIRYQTKPVRVNERGLNSFTEPEMKFLRNYQPLKILPYFIFNDDYITNECENKIKNKLNQLIIDDESVICDTNFDINQLISYVKTLLRLYPILYKIVDDALTHFEVRKQIYLNITQNYLDKMNHLTEILVKPNWPKLVEFLDNNESKVCHVLTEMGTDFGVAKVLKIVQISSEKLFAFEFRDILVIEQFFQLTEFLKNEKLKEILLLIEFKSGLENFFDLTRSIINRVKESFNLKLIIIRRQHDKFILNDEFECKMNVGITWNEIKDENKRIIVKKELVKFQGDPEKICMENLLRFKPNQLAEILDPETLEKLVKDEEVIVGNSITSSEEFYVPRTFEYKPFVKTEFFNYLNGSSDKDMMDDDPNQDLISMELRNVGGTSSRSNPIFPARVKPWVKPPKTLNDGIKDIVIVSLMTKSEMTKSDNDFKTSCQENDGKNVHWLKFYLNSYEIHKTRGKLNVLRKYIDDRVLEYSEDQLVENITDRKILIISDSPGMGKSTVLTVLAKKIKDKTPLDWVVRVNLNDCAQLLKISNKIEMKTVEDATRFLIDQIMTHGDCKLRTNFERKLFEKWLIKNGGIVLIFDGFDEVSPDYEEIVTRLLELILLETKVEKMIVTTRPHTKERLEDRLSTLSHTMVPFSKDNQIECIFGILKNNLSIEVAEELKNCVQTSITSLEESIKEEKTFFGIPLQCLLLAEYVMDKFLKGQHQELLFASLIDLYETFVRRKINRYYEEKNVVTYSDNHRRILNILMLNMHRRYAIKIILLDGKGDELINDELMELTRNEVLKVGLVVNTGNNPSFLHRTFAEFYVLDFMLSLSKNTEEESDMMHVLIIKAILLNPEFVVIRNFLESSIKNEKRVTEAENVLRSFIENVSIEALVSHTLIVDEQQECTFALFFNLLFEEYPSKFRSYLSNTTMRGTVLHIALESRNLNIIRLILHRVKNVKEDIINVKDNDGCTALHRASIRGHQEISRLLLEYGADMNIQFKKGFSSLAMASILGYQDIVRLHFENGAKMNTPENINHSLIFASSEGHLDISRLLLEKGADINFRDIRMRTPLIEALCNEHLDMVRFLLENGAEINVQNYFKTIPVTTASSKERLEIARLIWRICEDNNFLHQACTTGHLGIVEDFISKGVNINAVNLIDQSTPLHNASENGHTMVVSLLLEKGADVDPLGSRDMTPLHLAAEGGHLETVRVLLKHGANPLAKNKSKKTPLDYAIKRKRTKIIQLLTNGKQLNKRKNSVLGFWK